MTQWFRGGSSRRTGARPVPPLPQAPGGTGGSGFGGVGGAPPGPTAPATAGEQRDAVAGRGRGGPGAGTPGPGAGSTGTGGAGNGAGAGGARIGLPKLTTGPTGTAEERRFAQVYAEDRVGPMPYPNQASPDVAAARARVRALVDDLLPGGVDEGTGGALDPLIASWASGWLARIDSEHADHHAVVDRLVGGARQQLAEAEAEHERDRRALEIARTDYGDARERLMEPTLRGDEPGLEDDRRGSSGSRRTGGGLVGRLSERLGRRGGSGRGDQDQDRDRDRDQPRGRDGDREGGRHGEGARIRPEARVGPSEPATSPVRMPPASYREPLRGRSEAEGPAGPTRSGSGPSPAAGSPDAAQSGHGGPTG